VRDYLRQFARTFYAPLNADIRARGLIALKEQIERDYTKEGGKVAFRMTPDELVVDVLLCPAVSHMRAHGYMVARMFDETLRSVNSAICEGTPFDAELVRYDAQTGSNVQRFFRRAK